MSRLVVLAVSAVVGAGAAVPPTALAAPVSHAKLFVTRGPTVSCGIAIHDPSQRVTAVLCSASGVPAPRRGGIGDSGFVQLAAGGSPQLLAVSQDSFVSNRPATLGRGRRWSSLGVVCQVARQTVLCFNRDNHGFRIGNGRYTSF